MHCFKHIFLKSVYFQILYHKGKAGFQNSKIPTCGEYFLSGQRWHVKLIYCSDNFLSHLIHDPSVNVVVFYVFMVIRRTIGVQ